MRRKARVDANQKEIVATLRQHGYKVWHLHQVGDGMGDLLVLGMIAYRRIPAFLLVEVKAPGKEKDLRPDQIEFAATLVEWLGEQYHTFPLPYIVATTAAEIEDWFYN